MKFFEIKSKPAVFLNELSLFQIVRSKKRVIIAATRVSYFSGFQRIILLKNLENLYFLISKHFDFTFHFSKKSESILISLCTSRKRVKAFFFTLHFSKKSESFLFSLFTSRTSKTHSHWSLEQWDSSQASPSSAASRLSILQQNSFSGELSLNSSLNLREEPTNWNIKSWKKKTPI